MFPRACGTPGFPWWMSAAPTSPRGSSPRRTGATPRGSAGRWARRSVMSLPTSPRRGLARAVSTCRGHSCASFGTTTATRSSRASKSCAGKRPTAPPCGTITTPRLTGFSRQTSRAPTTTGARRTGCALPATSTSTRGRPRPVLRAPWPPSAGCTRRAWICSASSSSRARCAQLGCGSSARRKLRASPPSAGATRCCASLAAAAATTTAPRK